jgi:hypothetical protein
MMLASSITMTNKQARAGQSCRLPALDARTGNSNRWEQTMDSDRMTDREETRQADAKAKSLSEAEKVLCPNCGDEVDEDSIERCRCGKRICPQCGTVQHIEEIDDELFCGSPKCEKAALEAGIRVLEMLRDGAIAGINDKYTKIIDDVAKQIDRLNRKDQTEEVALILAGLDVVKGTLIGLPNQIKMIDEAMDLIRKLAKK